MWVPLMTDQLSSYVHDLSDNENIDAWWMKTGHMRLSNVMSYMTVKYELYTHICNHATPHAKTHTSISYKQALCLPLSHQIFNPFGCTVNQRETHVIVNLTANLEKRRMECKETPKFEWTFFSYYCRCTHIWVRVRVFFTSKDRRRRRKQSEDVPWLLLLNN